MKLRCSKLPLAFKCPGSIRGDASTETLVEMTYEGGPLGSAVHEVLATMVSRETWEPGTDPVDVRPVALKYGVDPDDLDRLVRYGAHAWKAISQYYPDPVTEQELEQDFGEYSLSGHIDVLALQQIWANFGDWKSGYKQSDYYAQIMGYAKLLFAMYETLEQVKGTIVWLRDWSQDTVLITRDDVAAFDQELLDRVVHWNGVYTAGEHCSYCPRFTACPARQALVRSALVEIGEYDRMTSLKPNGSVAILSEAALPHIVQMYREGKLSVVKGLLNQIDELIRTHIAATGPIDLGNGRELALVPEGRDTIDPLKAWPILTLYLENEELAKCLKVGKTAMLDAIGDKAGKGQKARAKAQVMEELKAVDAVHTSTIEKLRERKIDPTKEA